MDRSNLSIGRPPRSPDCLSAILKIENSQRFFRTAPPLRGKQSAAGNRSLAKTHFEMLFPTGDRKKTGSRRLRFSAQGSSGCVDRQHHHVSGSDDNQRNEGISGKKPTARLHRRDGRQVWRMRSGIRWPPSAVRFRCSRETWCEE